MTSNKIKKPKTYDKAINYFIYSNRWHRTEGKKL